jgi:lysophospholipase L1-like esterase
MNPRSALHRLEPSRRTKLTIALAVFCLIIGGWMMVTRYRDATETLPNNSDQNGQCTLWFVGSSSIHRWTSLKRDMTPWTAHNRGINSATYADILPRFAHIDPAQGRPRAIILYAGENDIATGVPVRTVIHQLAAFLDLRRQKFGDLPVLILSMKPSPARAASLPDQRLFNAAVQQMIAHMPASFYADITSPLLKDGELGDNYQPDGVHMSAQGYRIWADVVRHRLKQILPADTVRTCA